MPTYINLQCQSLRGLQTNIPITFSSLQTSTKVLTETKRPTLYDYKK